MKDFEKTTSNKELAKYYCKMESNSLENSARDIKMELDNLLGIIKTHILANEKIIKCMELANLIDRIKEYMKVDGNNLKWKALGFINEKMADGMKANSKLIEGMEEVG